MGDELRGENLVHLNVRFSTETELKKIQDFLYEKSGQGVSFTGLVEAMANEVTIVTAVHNIKANKGSRTAGVDKMKMSFKKSLRLIFMFFSFSSTRVLFFKKLSFYAADVDALGKIFLNIGINDQNRDDRTDDDCIGQAVC